MNSRLTTETVEGSLAKIPRDSIARSFGDAAASYDTFAMLQRKVADRLMQKIDASIHPLAMLDLGCGTGYCAAKMAKRYTEAALVAMDLALPMLQKTAETEDQACLVCGDAQELPFADNAFDLVICSLTLQWCAAPSNVMRELFRILKPGATALLSTFGPASLEALRLAYSSVDDQVHVNEFIPLDAMVEAAHDASLVCTATVETETRHYSSLQALARELKGIGAHNMNSGRPAGLTGKQKFSRACAAFAAMADQQGGVPVDYEILYLQLSKPSEE